MSPATMVRNQACKDVALTRDILVDVGFQRAELDSGGDLLQADRELR